MALESGMMAICCGWFDVNLFEFTRATHQLQEKSYYCCLRKERVSEIVIPDTNALSARFV